MSGIRSDSLPPTAPELDVLPDLGMALGEDDVDEASGDSVDHTQQYH